MSTDIKKTDILSPTAASVGFCIAGLIIALLFIVLPKLGSDGMLKLLLGSNANQALISSSKDSYAPLLDKVQNSDFLARTVVFGVWMFIGLVVYIVVTSVIGLFSTIEKQKHEMSFVHQNKDSLLHNDLVIVCFKLAVAAVWAIFTTVSIRYVLGHFVVTGYIALGGGAVTDWVSFAIASVLLFLALHVQVIFARLMVGRVRVWS